MPTTSLKSLREKFSREIKRRALSLESNLSFELKKYQKKQVELSDRKFKISDSKALMKQAFKSRFIFIGDFHTFEQYQKNALRFLKLYLKKKQNICLALEMVSSHNQYFIDAYLNGHITELEFLESIDYYETWRFPWSHYRQFFQLAKKHKLNIIALNSQGSLPERDQHAAEILAQHSNKSNELNYITLIGELHILPDNLPLLLKKNLSDDNDDFLIIHQNLDTVFWKLYDKPVNEDHIIQFNKQEFSINSSPPWLKYESMVYWYEQLLDDPAFDLHQYIMQTGLKTFGSSASENFLALGLELNNLFKLGLSNDDLEDFDLHDHQKMDYLAELAEDSSPSKALLSLYLNLLNRNISFKFYHNNDYYCSDYNLNRFTALVGVHLFHLEHSKINKGYVSSLFLKRSNNCERFLFLCYEKMFSYLSSKVFNPYIKCDLYRNLSHQSSAKLGEKAIDILDHPKDMQTIIKGLDISQLFQVSRIIGEFLGETFYQRVSHREIKSYRVSDTFFNTPYKLQDFINLKEQLLPNAIYKMQRKRNF